MTVVRLWKQCNESCPEVDGVTYRPEVYKIPTDYNNFKLWDCIFEIPREQRRRYTSNLIRELETYDAEKGSEYVLTLYNYLNSGKSLIETAKRLHIHRNTVVYRLERMDQLFDIKSSSGYEDMQNYFSCLLALSSRL